MKRCIYSFLLLFILSATATLKAQTIVVTSDTGDAITVEVTQEKVKEKKALKSATEILYNALFFRGLPDSQSCKNALVGTNEQFVNQHPDYFRQMNEGGRFNSFITSSRLVDWQKKNKISTCRFIINMKALRLDLEQQGVKRRFGF